MRLIFEYLIEDNLIVEIIRRWKKSISIIFVMIVFRSNLLQNR
jgi:hypothetical protein